MGDLMQIFPRSTWTSTTPRVGACADLISDIEHYTTRSVKGISVHYHGGSYPLLNRSPNGHFENIRRHDIEAFNYSDIKYNLGVAPRVSGVWELRGLRNKGTAVDDAAINGQYLAVYAQLAIDERPTDILLENLRAARNLVLAFYPNATEVVSHGKVSQKPTSCPGDYLHSVVEDASFWDSPTDWEGVGDNVPSQRLYEGHESIYTYSLISQLQNWGYHKGKNTGKYDSLVSQGVRELQVDLKEGGFYNHSVDGQYGPYTRRGWAAVLTNLTGMAHGT